MKKRKLTFEEIEAEIQKIIKEEIEKDSSLKDLDDGWILSLREIDRRKKIYEGLICTNDIISSYLIVNRKFNLDKKLKYDTDKNIIELNCFGLTVDLVKEIVILLNNLGWVGSKITIFDNKDRMYKNVAFSEELIDQKPIKITFLAKYNIIETGVPKYVYHVSLTIYRNRILKQGLVPKSKNKISSYNGRIYSFIQKDDSIDKNIKKLIDKLPEETKDRVKDDNDTISVDIYKIDTKNYLLSQIKWFKDSEWKDKSVYCIENIPSWAIKLDSTIKVKI